MTGGDTIFVVGFILGFFVCLTMLKAFQWVKM